MITVVILARNEERNLISLLPTLRWADTVIVIDDDSTDQTKQVCERFSVKYVQHRLDNDYARQRNFALSLVKKGWVLFLDADERMSEELVGEIKEIESNKRPAGYQIRRVDYFLGKRLDYGETKNIWLTRLALVGAGQWVGKVHEVWDIAVVHRLNGELRHYSHESIPQLFHTVSRYAWLHSRELFEQKHYWSLWEQLSYPLGKIMYTFIIRLGFLDGWRGLVMSLAMSWHSWLVRWYLWEKPWDLSERKKTLRKYLAIVPLILLPLGQFTRGTIQGVSFYAFEVFMGLTFVVTGFGYLRRKRWIMMPLWMKLLTVTTFCWLLSFLLSIVKGYPVIGGLYWVRWCIYLGYGFVLGQFVLEDKSFLVHGLIRYVSYGVLVGGMVQYILFPDMRWLALLGWDDHYFRMIGTLFDPNYFGLMMALGLWWVLFKTEGWERRIMSVLMGGAVIASYSRASLIIVGMMGVFYGLKFMRWKQMGAVFVIGLGLFAALPKPGGEGVNILRSFSISSRVESWVMGWDLFIKNPFIGIGFNQYPAVLNKVGAFGAPYHPSAPDSSWLYILATTGLLGFIPFLALLWSWWKSEPETFVRGTLAIIMIHSLINNSFFYPWVLLWWWLILLQQYQEKQALS